jgi:hypothetical protein
MAKIEFAEIRPSGTIEGKVDALYDAYFMMRKQMMYYLSGALDSENIQSISTDLLIAGEAKISTAFIEDLEVGRNVTMGPDATISWSKVTGAPSIPTLPGYIKSTYIDATSVSSPAIRGGIISGAVFTNLTGTVLNPTYNYCLELGDYDGYNAFSFFTSSNVSSNPASTLNTIFSVYDADFGYTSLSGKLGYSFLTVDGLTETVLPWGTWDFSNAIVEGIDGSGGGIYKFG